MSFTYISALPNPIREDISKVSSFEADIDTIKKYLVEIGNTYLLVAFRIYEISVSESFKPMYKNIVDACNACLGFKKSTTYNMLNIVKTFGKPDLEGHITYKSLFLAEKFSYSQLCEMLSLSDQQRSKVTPDMTIKEIRQIKKDDVIDIEPSDLKDVSSVSFQTSGNIFEPDVNELMISNSKLRSELDEVNSKLSILSESKGLCNNLKDSSFSFKCDNCGIYLSDLDDIEVVKSLSNSLLNHYGYSFKYCPECGCRVKNYKPFDFDEDDV